MADTLPPPSPSPSPPPPATESAELLALRAASQHHAELAEKMAATGRQMAQQVEAAVSLGRNLTAEFQAAKAIAEEAKRVADKSAADLEAMQISATRPFAHAPRIEEAPVTISVLPTAVSSSIHAIEQTVTRQPTRVEDRWTKFGLAMLVLAASVFNYLANHH